MAVPGAGYAVGLAGTAGYSVGRPAFTAGGGVASVARAGSGAAASGLGGGVDLVVTGWGFGAPLPAPPPAVSLCGAPCAVASWTPTSVACRAGPLATAEGVAAYAAAWPPGLLAGAPYQRSWGGAVGSPPAALFDGNPATAGIQPVFLTNDPLARAKLSLASAICSGVASPRTSPTAST